MKHGQMLKDLMQTPNFRVSVVQEADTVEICGALKVGEQSLGLCRELGAGGMMGSWMQPSPELHWEENPPHSHCFPERGGCRSWFL